MIDSTTMAVIEGFQSREAEVDGAEATVDRKATMDADLDTLCTVIYCTADDLLPEKPGNARRRVTDAEVVTLCVAQAIMGIPSDRRFLAVARKRLGDLFPELPQQPGFHKRRARLAETIEWLIGVFAAESPGFHDDLLLIDSTPVECARSVADDTTLGARRRRRLRLLRLPFALLLGLSPARPLRARRHSSCLHPRLSQARRARGRARAAPTREQVRRGDRHRRQGLCRARLRRGGRRARRHDRPAGAQGRARHRPSPRADPPADRVDLLDLQGHAHPRAPRCPHPAQPACSHRPALPGTGRLHRAQPQARASESSPGRLRRLRAWNQSSRSARLGR